MEVHSTRSSPTVPRRVAVIHGYSASPDDHWFRWLSDQLESTGVPCEVPALPDPRNPNPGAWKDALRRTVGVPDAGTAVVAHSLGCLATLRHLKTLEETEELKGRSGSWRLGSLILVAGFIDRLPALPELDDFIGVGEDVTGLADHIDRTVVLRSDDDPLVPPALTDRLAVQLGVRARVVPGGGHFLSSDGFRTFPGVLGVLGGVPGVPGAPDGSDDADG